MIYLGGDIELEHLENIAVTKIYENSLFNWVSNPAFTMALQVNFYVCFVLGLFESLLKGNHLWIYSPIPNITDYKI